MCCKCIDQPLDLNSILTITHHRAGRSCALSWWTGLASRATAPGTRLTVIASCIMLQHPMHSA
jgi:hypothetical protein